MKKCRGVVLSGLPCAGKSVLSERLQAEYHWQEYPFGKILRTMWRKEWPDASVSFEDWWPEVPIQQLRDMNNECKEAIAGRSFIVDSRYTHFYSPEDYVKVFVFADRHTRAIRGIAREMHKTPDEIEPLFSDAANVEMQKRYNKMNAILDVREKSEMDKGIALYNADYTDFVNYDLTLNARRFTIAQEFDAVRALVGRAE